MISALTPAMLVTANLNTALPSWYTKCSRASTVCMLAGRMLGVKPVELKELPERENPGGGGGDFTFAPQIIIQGNADRSVIDEALAEAKAQFEAWYLQMQRKQARTAY